MTCNVNDGGRDTNQWPTCLKFKAKNGKLVLLISLAMPRLLLHRLLLLLLLVAASRGDTSGDHRYDTSMCLRQTYNCSGVNITYPFYLSEETKDLDGYGNTSCGYPGMGVRCDDDRGPILQLNATVSVVNLVIKSIGDRSANVSLADLDVRDPCPRMDYNFSLPRSSWLYVPDNSTVDYLDFFLDCTPGIVPPGEISLITCRSAYTPSFVFPENRVPPGSWSQACKMIRVPVLKYDPVVANSPEGRGSGYSSVLRQGFPLAWKGSQEPCSRCEESKGRCGYNETREFIGCLCPGGRVTHDICNSAGGSKKGIIAGAVAGAGVGVLLVAAVIAFFIRKRKQRKVSSSSKLLKYSGSGGTPTCSRGGDMESGGTDDLKTHHFSYEELEAATDSFSESREIGDGGFGTVYKGYLGDGRVVAVKRLYNNSYRRVEQFLNEAGILSRLRHPNLVMFYGCTSSQSRELLLVYEFVKNGTVADHLHGPRAPERALSWPLRLSIAVESAAALTYLHAIEQPIVHRDVKTTNILLDTDFHVKVADFGLSRLFPLDVTHVSTAPQGTPGYVDPEYHQCYQLTDKSDVYSFGVVLIELISSKPAVDITRKRNEINLAGMAINKIQNCQLEQLVDRDLGYDSDPATKKMMTMVAELAFRCLQQNGEMRPPIKEVHAVLRGIQDECVVEKGGHKKDKDLDPPFSPDTVHAPWDSRTTTPNTSQ